MAQGTGSIKTNLLRATPSQENEDNYAKSHE